VKPIAIFFRGHTLGVEAPDDLAPRIAAFFALATPPRGAAPPAAIARITETGSGRFTLVIDDRPAQEDLSRGEIIARLAAEVAAEAPLAEGAITLKAAAVGWNEKAILIVGPAGAGKSALAAWLIDKGFAYLADDSVVLPSEGGVVGFPGPIALGGRFGHIADLSAFREAPSVRAGERVLICPDRTWSGESGRVPCGLIVDVRHESGGGLYLEPMTTEQIAGRLLDTLASPVSEQVAAFIRRFTAETPAVRLAYGNYAQVDGLLDFLSRAVVEGSVAPQELSTFLSRLPRAAVPQQGYAIPARTERVLKPKLTIGMATFDDYDGTYFTIQALRMYHPEIMDESEIVVVDNHPQGPCGEPLKKLENAIPNYRYIPYPNAVGTAAAKDRVFQEAAGEFVLCLDCHVFVVKGALRRLLDYLESEHRPLDLLHGPLLYDDLKSISTHLDPRWRGGFYGTWATSDEGRDAEGPPFEIPLQGMGLFACRKDAWVGFNPEFRGFGGEEGYIHAKVHRAGGRVMCLPFLRWVHRFNRPMGVPYPNIWEERIRNYVIGARELGLPLEPMRDHFAEVLGASEIDRILSELG
jgi:hypothetical protein